MLTAVQADLYLHHLEIQSNNPLGLAKFYSSVMSMQLNKVNNKKIICNGPSRKIIISQGNNRTLSHVGMVCRSNEPIIYANLSSYAVLIERYINKIFFEIEAYHNNDLNKD